MMVSTRGRYALRVMIDLAEHGNGSFIPLRDVAERQDISEKYLESILSVLSKAGFVRGLRGKGGGYQLTRAPSAYTVGSILKLTEGSLAPVACLDCHPNPCEKAASCRTLPMWEKLDRLVDEYLESVTVEDLCGSPDNYVI
jgi:Rrf2 family iron-sulfur cluster assembly transcriptional regulator